MVSVMDAPPNHQFQPKWGKGPLRLIKNLEKSVTAFALMRLSGLQT
jgi:hypothetical protein